jgi:antitoxin component YwqK of YwqJK toxin-antitoxin module
MLEELKYPNGKLKSKINYEDGKKNGLAQWYYETGELLAEVNYIDNKASGVLKEFYENGNLKALSHWIDGAQDGKASKYYENGSKMRDSIVKNGKFVGEQTEWWNNGNLKAKKIFSDDVEKKIKIYNEKGILFEEHEFLFIEDDKIHYDIKSFYLNGNLKSEYNYFKYLVGSYKEKCLEGKFKDYYENGKIKSEINYKDNHRQGLTVSYFETGKIKNEQIFDYGTCQSLKEWDKNGKLINSIKFKNGDSRTVLLHEVMTKGGFRFSLNDGTELDVFGQRHTLYEVEQFFEDCQWRTEDDDKYDVDEFHLTGYDEGFIYYEEDLYDFFDIKKDSNIEWDFNGFSSWEETKEEWSNFKSKFEPVNSKEQFDARNN